MQATVYPIPVGWLSEGSFIGARYDEETGELIEPGEIPWETRHALLGYLQQQGFRPKKGDIAFFTELADWGNHARLILTENGFEPLDYIWSEAGSPPMDCSLPEFPPHYWDSAIPGIEVVYLSLDPYEAELRRNLTVNSTSVLTPEGEVLTVYFDGATPEERANLATKFQAEVPFQEFLPVRLTPQRVALNSSANSVFYPV